MNNQWQEYLLDAGANLSPTGTVTFPDDNTFSDDRSLEGDNELALENVLCDLSGDIVLRVTGEDAESFLQGQFSNDVQALGIPESQLSTWSSPKGRVLSVFRLIRDEEGYLIKMPQELAEPIQKRLKMFVLMAKVQIEHNSDLVCFGVSGTGNEAVLEKFISIPASVDDCAQANGVTLYRVRGEKPRFEVIASVDKAKEIWQALSGSCTMTGEGVWRLLNIDAGVPSISASTTEAFVLQMLNLHHIDGVSFKKGCFPGQEVVARMQYLGKLKRRMYRARVSLSNGAELPLPGDEVFNQDVASPVGKVVDAQFVGDTTARLLLVNAIAATEKALFLDTDATKKIELLDLPYSVDADQ